MLLVVACYFDNFVFIQSHGFAPNTAFFFTKKLHDFTYFYFGRASFRSK